MPYQPDTIAGVVNRLNVQYFLPAIQREFVWTPDQIVRLFDSLMRGYPISSFLFWELKPENRDKWELYRFLTDFSQKSPHNPLASGVGVQQLNLVLDGQQRLTSLLIGLKGTYKAKVKHKRWDNPEAWVKMSLYLDVLKDPKSDNASDGDLRYGFGFFAAPPKNTEMRHWFRVGEVLGYDSESEFDDFVEAEKEKLPESATRAQMNLMGKTLQRLYRAVWKDQVISHYTEHDQDYDRVLDIFVRANEGGTKLSKSDLLLSMVTLKWDGINAREEIYQFVDRLNEDLTRKNNFDKDFVMKTCLVVSDLEVTYRVENFNKQNLEVIRQRWPKIKAAIEKAVDLVNWFGIDRDNLTSANALIPIVYYLYQHPAANFHGGSTPFESRNAGKMRRWIALTLLNNIFGGSSDNTLRDTRKVLQEKAAGAQDDFPNEAIEKVNVDAGRASFSDQYTVDSFLASTYGKKLTYLALTLLYDDNHWGTAQAHQDHIFPQSLFTGQKLAAAGLDEEQQARYRSKVNSIGNLELLLGVENQEKSDKDFGDWLSTRDTAFKKKHLIPDDPDLLQFDRFEDFITAREQLIAKRLDALFV